MSRGLVQHGPSAFFSIRPAVNLRPAVSLSQPLPNSRSALTATATC